MPMAAAVAGTQQYVPVSVVEQNGRQMLLTNAAAVQSGWAPNRQMFAAVPTWQQFSTTAGGRIQQPTAAVLSESDAWSRSLVLERTALLPEQTAVLPMEFHDPSVYDHLRSERNLIQQQTNAFSGVGPPWGVVACGQPSNAHQSSHYASQQNLVPAHNATILAAISSSKRNTVASIQTKAVKAKEHLSPVKKRVKESSSPKWQDSMLGRHVESGYGGSINLCTSSTISPIIDENKNLQKSTLARNASLKTHQTITIEDTPSPAVSVITISDSEDSNERSPLW